MTNPSPDQVRSDRAELSTLHAQLDDLVRRVVVVAERHDDTDSSAVAGELFGAERSLIAARRALERALGLLA